MNLEFRIKNAELKDKETLHSELFILNSETGLTLIEALIGVAVSSLIGVILISTLVQNNGLFTQQTARVNQGLSINKSSSQISDLIRSSGSIVSQYPDSSPQYFSNSSTIILALPSLDVSGNVIDNQFDHSIITTDLDNPKILRKLTFPNLTAPSSRKPENQVLTTSLATINFYYYDNNGSVVSPSAASKVNYTLSQIEKAGAGDVESNTSAQINLRNN